MTEQEQAALFAAGQQEADRQMLETLLSLDPQAQEYFDLLYQAKQSFGEIDRLDDFVQYWRDIPLDDSGAGC